MNFLYALYAWLRLLSEDEPMWFWSLSLAVILCLVFAPVGTFFFLAFIVGIWALLYWIGLVEGPDDEPTAT